MKKNMIIYSIMIYVVFFVLFILTGIVSTFITSNPVVMQGMVTVCSWTATIVLMVMFSRLVKDKTRKEFVKGLFRERLSWKLIALILVVQLTIFIVCVGAVSLYHHTSIWQLLNGSLGSIVGGFFVQLIGGPLGEEPAYRGFSLSYMQKECGVIKAGLITGVIWGMWHLPLWLISGYKGLALLLYCVSFLVPIVACSIVMSVIYKYRKNLVYAILIHQMVNFSLDILYTGDLLEIFVPFAVLYVLGAGIIVLWFLYKERSNKFRLALERNSVISE